jgi:hypothetical protein
VIPLPELSRRRRLLVLVICSSSLFIVGLDSTIVNIALPAIGRDLHASVAGLQWTVDGYALDPVGQALIIVMLGSLTYAIIEGPALGWRAPVIMAMFTVAAAALAVFVAYEMRRDEPVLDPGFFRSAPFAGSVLTAISATAAVGGFLFLATLYLQDVRAMSALQAGLHILPMAVMMALGAVHRGRRLDPGREPARRPAARRVRARQPRRLAPAGLHGRRGLRPRPGHDHSLGAGHGRSHRRDVRRRRAARQVATAAARRSSAGSLGR